MPDVLAFKSGRDLAEEPGVEDEDTVTCVDCGAVEPDDRAYQNGWQFVPPVCPNCLRWVAVEETCCFGGAS